MGVLITPIRVSFHIRNLERIFPFFRREDFSGFFSKPISGAITAAAAITTATATATFIIITITRHLHYYYHYRHRHKWHLYKGKGFPL